MTTAPLISKVFAIISAIAALGVIWLTYQEQYGRHGGRKR